MHEIEKAYCNVCIGAVIAAWRSLMETPAIQVLTKVKYGKGDTLGLDAISEITIEHRIKSFDAYGILITEEIGESSGIRWPSDPDPVMQPLMLFSDPTDRSSQLVRFYKKISEKESVKKIGELMTSMSDGQIVELWESIHGMPEKPAIITGATTSITCLRKGKLIFTVILNYITQDIFVACGVGIFYFKLPHFSNKKINSINLDHIARNGKPLHFLPSVSTCQTADDFKKFVSFLGTPEKKGYSDNFQDCMIFVESPDKFVHHRVPGGPARVLYLSELQKGCGPIGFIMANGEKISEWIHWLTFAKFAKNQHGANALRVFEVSIDRPWTKDGVLMSTPPQYSIFRMTEEGTYLDMSRLKNFHSPSRFRSMLVITPYDNERIIQIMRQHQYREILVI